MLLMAPRNNSGANSNIVYQQQQPQPATAFLLSTTTPAFYGTDETYNQFAGLLESPTSTTTAIINSSNMSPMQQTTSGNSNTANPNVGNDNANNNITGTNNEKATRCCQPSGDCCKAVDALILLEDLSDCVRVICNNENCNVGQYMHRECFESFEQTVLGYLKTISRARSWSDRQRAQNLWTKKGYDLVYKACPCKCGRGHIRKDLEWSAPPICKNGGIVGGQRMLNGGDVEDDKKKKKKRNRNNQKAALPLSSVSASGFYQNNQQQQQQQQQHQHFGQQQQNSGNSALIHDTPPNGVVNNISPNPNVGVIGSGLPHNSGSNNNQSQKQQMPAQNDITGLDSILLVCGNILGLDLRDRAGSLSSGGGSGSTSPSASHSSGDVSISPIHPPQQQQQQNLNQHIMQQSPQKLQQQQQHQQHVQQLQQQYPALLHNGLSSSILNGVIGNTVGVPVTLMASKQQQQTSPLSMIGNGLKLKRNMSPIDQQHLVQQQKNKEVEIYSERVRVTSGCNGIFSRRLDFSSFNLLPKTRLNSYQVKIEDEGNHGNDETRLFILSSLAQSQMSRVACILCEEPMLVFDRYPLVDGSFFLSPRQHSSGCIEVKHEGRALYLTCVCMGCLDGTASSRIISCRFCGDIWDGSNLVIGTMYAYDIFAAMPCCAERLKCNTCFKLLLNPQQRLNFYSDYSHCVTCPYCATPDTHFVKPLGYCYAKSASPPSSTAVATLRHGQIA